MTGFRVAVRRRRARADHVPAPGPGKGEPGEGAGRQGLRETEAGGKAPKPGGEKRKGGQRVWAGWAWPRSGRGRERRGSERRLLARAGGGGGGGGGSRGGRREAGGGGEAGARRRRAERCARSADPRGTRARLPRGAAAHGERAAVAGAALGLEAAAGREEREDGARAAWAASAATRRGGRGAWLLRRQPGPLSAPPARPLRFVPEAPEGAAPLGGARLPASACLVHLDDCSGEVRGVGRRRP
ncbi:hypothetical protein J1605_015245 [Eschrichtius robustus]|uniref:Uncharacterized protein n=1 Tax=Eschrichtius robustus TaxID=9764 RepID=A0AB34GAD4_ESCRO|nr:hypothetical protein J1605_015245 [Eschrichtius robustus]